MGRDTRPGAVAAAASSVLGWLARAEVRAHMAPPGAAPPSGDTTAGPSPGDTTADPPVCVWPVALLPDQTTRRSDAPESLRLRVRFLVAGGSDGGFATSFDLLDRALTASLSDSSVEPVLEPVAAEAWRGFGLPPQLGMLVDVPVRVVSPSRPPAPRVGGPVHVDSRPLARLHGTVVGPGAVPVPGVRVVVRDTGATAYTGGRGEFAFPALPAGEPVRLHLSARGRELVADVGPGDEPVVIHCDMEGD